MSPTSPTFGGSALLELFADPVWAEVYIAVCCDVLEAPSVEAARGFGDAILAQNPPSRPDRLTLRGLRLGPTTVSCMGLQLKDRPYTRLDLSNNQLGDCSALSVRSLVRALPRLRELHLAGNHIGPEGAQEIAEELEVNATLEVLAFGEAAPPQQGPGGSSASRGFRPNAIGSDGLKAMLNNLGRNPRLALTSLNLRQTSLGAEAGRHLAAYLERDQRLAHLDVSCNPLSSQGVCAMLPHCAGLRLLDIADTGCRGELIHSQLASLLQRTSSLARLSLARNEFEPRPLQRIARAVAACEPLTSLSLAGTEMGTEGITVLISALLNSEVPTLTELDLSWNQLCQVEAATALSHLLAQYCTLHVLRLSHNSLGDAGLLELAGALDPGGCPECTLHTLELGSCRVGTAGAAHLFGCLARNESLRVLRLPDNFLDDALDLALIEGLGHLHELALVGNRLSHAAMSRAAQAISRNRLATRNREPAALRSEMHRMLFQETKLSRARRQADADEEEVSQRVAETETALRELEDLKATHSELQTHIIKKIGQEELELAKAKQRREELAARLEQVAGSYEEQQQELRDAVRQQENELLDMQARADETEKRLAARRKEHPEELRRLHDRARVGLEEAAQLQEQARNMRHQLSRLQDKSMVDFKP